MQNPKLRRVTNGHVTAVPRDGSNSDFFLEGGQFPKEKRHFYFDEFLMFLFQLFFTEPGMHFC